MTDAFDVEAYLEEQTSKVKNAGTELKNEPEKKGKDERHRSSRSREGVRDRDRDSYRDRSRDRDRGRDYRGRRDDSRDRNRPRDRDNRRDYGDRDGGRDRDDRRSDRRKGRSASRSASPPRSSRRARSRSPEDRGPSTRKPIEPAVAPSAASEMSKKEKEIMLAAEKETARQQREIDDLTKDQRTIFVSQLTKKVTEAQIDHFFSAIGKVKNIIMVRDKLSGHHKGFAYVEMDDLASIPACLLFNNVVPDFQKFPILVKASEAEKNFLAKKDPFNMKSAGILEAPGPGGGADTRIYVGNIHVSIDDSMLTQVLEQFGSIDSLKLHRDHVGNSKGFAFVKYKSADSAMLAMQALPGIELLGRPMKVGPVVDHTTGPGMTNYNPATSSTGAAMMMAANLTNAATSGGSAAAAANLMQQQQQMMADTAANGQQSAAMFNSFSDPYSNHAAVSGNWKLENDEGGAGLAMNAQSRYELMMKLGAKAGLAPTAPATGVAAPVTAMAASVAGMAASGGGGNKPAIIGTPSAFLMISNMFDPATETEANWDREIAEDVSEECRQYGRVIVCQVDVKKAGGYVYLQMDGLEAGKKVAAVLHGRYFAGRMITVSYLDEGNFQAMLRA